METLLIFAIVSLSMSIFAAAGFWYLRDRPERRQSSPQLVAMRRRAESERWDQAVRASRN